MINRFFGVICCLAIVTVFVIAGCDQQYKSEPVAYEPLLDPNFIVPDYASSAMKATGGVRQWADTKKIQLDCVVTFYKPDRSFYLTEHRYEIRPWENYIRVLDIEPQGQFVWQLSDDGFIATIDSEQIDVDSAAKRYRNFAEIMLNIITAPVRFLDQSVEFTTSGTAMRVEGLWYYPIERSYRVIKPSLDDTNIAPRPVERHWSEVTFYQNKDSALVDTLWFVNLQKDKFLTVRAHDYRKLEAADIMVPGKVEIFRADAKGVQQELLVTVDF